MTQIGLDYLKNAETKRSNFANEKIQREKNRLQELANQEIARANAVMEAQKWATLQQQADIERAKLQQQHDIARMQNTANIYGTQKSYDASVYATDKNTRKGTLAGDIINAIKDTAFAGAPGGLKGLAGVLNGLGFLWDTLI